MGLVRSLLQLLQQFVGERADGLGAGGKAEVITTGLGVSPIISSSAMSSSSDPSYYAARSSCQSRCRQIPGTLMKLSTMFRDQQPGWRNVRLRGERNDVLVILIDDDDRRITVGASFSFGMVVVVRIAVVPGDGLG